VHEVIWYVYEVYDTVPAYTVFTRVKKVACNLTQDNAEYTLATYLGQYLKF